MDENKGVTCERDEERINEGRDEMDGYGGSGSTCERDEGRSNEGIDEMDGVGEWEYMRLPNTLTMVATIWQLQRQHQRWQRRWYHHPSDYP